jgi:hypothetical protein
MNKVSDGSLTAKPPHSVDSNVPTRPHVRYVGFEGIDSGRRLRFRVKSNHHESVEVTFDVADAIFINTRGISIQDAAPMAYEKLIERLATEGSLESDRFCLTNVDVERYLDRHMSSQKRTSSLADESRRSDIAA